MAKLNLEDFRFFLKDTIRKKIDFRETDQNRGIEPPGVQKKVSDSARIIDLVGVETFKSDYTISLTDAIAMRRSVRKFSDKKFTLKELSFLLWATQGVREAKHPAAVLRTVPSAGARHSFETYLFIRRVEGLEEGIYRYLPLNHQLVFEFREDDLAEKISRACLGQRFAGNAAATFFWVTIPYRMEWRYHLAAHRVIAIDAGHVCQNLYLACQAIGAGTCAIGAYDQEMLDALLRLDGEDEFVIYLAPVGKV
jgi:SagB-type dehydrogenase family enzyme